MEETTKSGTWLEAIAGLLIVGGIGCGIAANIVALLNLPPRILSDGRIGAPLEGILIVAFGLCMLIGALIPSPSCSKQ